MTTPITLPAIVPYHAETMRAPALDGFAVTPSDTVNFPSVARFLYVGTGGTVVLLTPANTMLTFTSVASGTQLYVMCGRVNNTNTTASNIVGLV